jgi:phosphoglycerate dehydrogenase-like enzyme
MNKHTKSRRSFIATFTAGGIIASTDLTSLVSPASSSPVFENVFSQRRNPDEPIRIVNMMKFSAEELEQIKKDGKNVELITATDAKDPNQISNAEVILGFLDAKMLEHAKKLKWMQTPAAGVENMSAELIKHPCVLTNMQRVFAPVIAESAIALLLSLTRGLAQVSIPALREKKWTSIPKHIILDDLYGKTIGIVGMGGIGSETARRLHYGFQMKVLSTDAKPLPKPEYVHELHDPSWFMEMVPQVDVLMSAAPLTKHTRGMFNAEVFNRMKPTAYFINVSRGGLVDQPALVTALKEHRIKGAGLDVTTPEPLPSNDPLWTCPNLVITPHNSGQAPIRQTRLVALVAENIRRYSNGLPLMNVVDKINGY